MLCDDALHRKDVKRVSLDALQDALILHENWWSLPRLNKVGEFVVRNQQGLRKRFAASQRRLNCFVQGAWHTASSEGIRLLVLVPKHWPLRTPKVDPLGGRCLRCVAGYWHLNADANYADSRGPTSQQTKRTTRRWLLDVLGSDFTTCHKRTPPTLTGHLAP